MEDLEKVLVKLLRHHLHEMEDVDENGGVDILGLLKKRDVNGRFLVDKDGKIRATHGHSWGAPINTETAFIRITSSIPTIIHYTTLKAWNESIKVSGISRMSRLHIHFVDSEERGVQWRKKEQNVAIYVNMEAAMEVADIHFWRPKVDNGVIISTGNSRGILSPQFFARVIFL